MTEQTTDETVVDDALSQAHPTGGFKGSIEPLKSGTTPISNEDAASDGSIDPPETAISNGDADEATEQEVEDETFSRDYVQELRDEAAGYRVKAKDRDDLAKRLHTALVAATGRLADPSDLPFDEAHLTDPDALTAAIEDLVSRKPHLVSRRPVGDVGQGAAGADSSVDLAGILRARAG